MARPSKLTPDRVARITAAQRAGAPIHVACARGLIGESTYYEWEARGRAALDAHDHDLDVVPEADRPYAEFSEAVRAARYDYELGLLGVATREAQGIPIIDAQGNPTPVLETETRTSYDKDGNMIGSVVIERRGLKPNARTALTILERRNPQVYGRTYRAEVTGPEGAPIEMTVEDLVARGKAAGDELAARRDRKSG